MKALRLLTASLFLSAYVFGQADSTDLFEKFKGKWEYPIKHFYKIQEFNQEKFERSGGCFPIISTAFISNSNQQVKALFEGLVSVYKVDDYHLIITKYGDYTIMYSGLTKPLVNDGDFIKRGQIISYIKMDIDNQFCLDIFLSRKSQQINPYDWFDHKSCQ